MTHLSILRKNRLAIIFLFFAIFAVALPPANLAPVPVTSVDAIGPGELRMHLEFLASEELGGRYTLSPSFPVAARYLASHLAAYGFTGAGDHGDFFQRFAVISSKPDPQNTSLAITIQGKTESYSFGDFLPVGSGGKAEGQVVFVGYGISSPGQHRDDYANVDVKGKIVLVVSGTPEGVNRSALGREETMGEAAMAHGAIGVLQIPPARFGEMMKRKEFKERLLSREAVRLAKDVKTTIPVAVLSADVAQKLVAGIGLRWKDIQDAEEGKPLSPKATEAFASLALAFQQRQINTQNVVGVLQGSDPVLKNEYVAFSAHYDHLETNPEGKIFPGADDDGSGTTSVLTIAHALALQRPKRSVLVIFHAGEELGLLGSRYNTEYAPVVPLDHIIVDLNLDMVGRSKPPGDHERADEHLSDNNTIYLVGANRISKELQQISEETNSDYQKLKLDYYYDDPANPERIYYRSDHWNYARHGIPVIFYFDGTHVDYHRTTDTIDKIDFDKMTKVARLVFETGWRLANLDHTLAKDAH